ncbi:MAG: hypothetical protein JRE58_12415, partial [Deltaproteobacteria bacterium]|nr:hypothetical protein [Deltaproteobacteria bacterium]
MIKSILKNIFGKLGISKQPGQDIAASAQRQAVKIELKKETPSGMRKESDAKAVKKPVGRPKKPAGQSGVEKIFNKKPWNISKFEVPVIEGRTRFHDLKLPNPIMHA